MAVSFKLHLEPGSLFKSRNSIRKTFIEILERIFDNLPFVCDNISDNFVFLTEFNDVMFATKLSLWDKVIVEVFECMIWSIF